MSALGQHEHFTTEVGEGVAENDNIWKGMGNFCSSFRLRTFAKVMPKYLC